LIRDRFEYALFACIGGFVRLLPLRFAQRLATFLAFISYFVFGVRKQVTLENLRNAFPEKSEKEIRTIAFGAYKSYATALIEFLWFPRLNVERILRMVKQFHLERVMQALGKGKGLILVSGHFGNWELIAAATGLTVKHSLLIIVQKQSNKFVDATVNKYRCLFGNGVVTMEQAVREIFARLRSKGMVAMLADQSAGSGDPFVDFFGRPAATHKGPAIFSLKTGAPIVMGFLVRQPDHSYHLYWETVDSDDLTEYNEENVLELTRRHVAMLERYIRQYPDQWLWMHRRWKHTPPKALS
jgi:KDO2-lipid IV(A) lauroyltransferase